MVHTYIPISGIVTLTGIAGIALMLKFMANALLKLMQASPFCASGTCPLLSRLITNSEGRYTDQQLQTSLHTYIHTHTYMHAYIHTYIANIPFYNRRCWYIWKTIEKQCETACEFINLDSREEKCIISNLNIILTTSRIFLVPYWHTIIIHNKNSCGVEGPDGGSIEHRHQVQIPVQRLCEFQCYEVIRNHEGHLKLSVIGSECEHFVDEYSSLSL